MNNDRKISLQANGGVARATVNLRFTHPVVDPAEITERLGLVPTLTKQFAYPRPGTDGTAQPTIVRQTRWVLSKSFYQPEPASDGEDDPPFDVNGALAELVEALVRDREFVRRVAEGGEASIEIGLPGQRYIGFVVDPHVLAQFADLGLGFGIEVFPDSAT